jgi:hypothetical protein
VERASENEFKEVKLGPKFVIRCPAEDTCFAGSTPDDAWELLKTRIKLVRGAKGELVQREFKQDGPFLFGLALPGVVEMLERLPGAGRCNGYQFRYFQPASEKIVWKPRVNPSGSARCEPYNREVLNATLQSKQRLTARQGSAGSTSTQAGKSRGYGYAAEPVLVGGLAATMQCVAQPAVAPSSHPRGSLSHASRNGQLHPPHIHVAARCMYPEGLLRPTLSLSKPTHWPQLDGWWSFGL